MCVQIRKHNNCHSNFIICLFICRWFTKPCLVVCCVVACCKNILIVYLFMSDCLQSVFLLGLTLSQVGTFLIDPSSDSFFVVSSCIMRPPVFRLPPPHLSGWGRGRITFFIGSKNMLKLFYEYPQYFFLNLRSNSLFSIWERSTNHWCWDLFYEFHLFKTCMNLKCLVSGKDDNLFTDTFYSWSAEMWWDWVVDY